MTPEQFAQEVRESAWTRVRVQVGFTNGLPVLHIADLDGTSGRRQSTTIRSYGEWLIHPLNKRNRPPRKREAEKEEAA